MSGAFRRVPSPLHGTSHRIRSKYNPFVSSSDISVSTMEFSVDMVSECPLLSFNPGKSWASWLVTTMFGLHMRLVWWINRWHLFTSESLAMTCTKQAKDLNVIGQITIQLHVSSKSIKNSIFHNSSSKKRPQEPNNCMKTHHAIWELSKFDTSMDHLQQLESLRSRCSTHCSTKNNL